MKEKHLNYYSKTEETLNILTHGLGLLLSIAALVFLILKAAETGRANYVVSFTLFGTSLILLYAASTFYHASMTPKIRAKLNSLDHAMIYLLIAGTYTPYTLVTLQGWVGWTIFGVVWGIALAGFCFKLFYTGRFEKLSTLSYVALGWIIILAIVPLVEQLASGGLYWLVTGGVLYTIGAVLYSIPKLKYNHAIFHVFVVLGSISHFVSVYCYV
ncbi:MAG: hemolysin III family protein [Leptolyngbya sp. SIO3F4]|nr:hemolysin III family protein [Leptolyngbya sp. SIO3F4]